MVTSKLISRSRTTIPQAVRQALGLEEGDEIGYEIQGRRVILAKAEASDEGWTSIALDAFAEEWNGDADRTGYATF